MTILPSEHAARLLEYYIRSLVERSGLRWTAANTADFDQLAELLDAVDAAPALDSIPPYERPIVSDRVTQILEREEPPTARAPIAVDPEWEKFQRWRAARAEEERYEQTRRLVGR
jgi:hypothetical protein